MCDVKLSFLSSLILVIVGSVNTRKYSTFRQLVSSGMILLFQISWLSLVGLVTMSGVVVSMIVYSATHPLVITSFSQLPAFDVTTCPIAIGIVVFSYAAHAQFPDMERSMAVPERFPRAINAAFIYVTVLYIGVAASGFLTFGKDADEIVSKNMTKPIRTIINVLLLINLLLSYALPMFPVATIFERFLRHFFPLVSL